MKGVKRFFSLVTFSHTIFALPFALLAAVLAAGGAPELRTLFWILLAMAGARSAAMAFNRIVDRDVDAKNPRTAGREIPAGAVSVTAASAFCALSAAVFVLAAWFLNPLCLALSPLALAIVLGYSFTKRLSAAFASRPRAGPRDRARGRVDRRDRTVRGDARRARPLAFSSGSRAST